MIDYYEILGLEEGSEHVEVKRAYLRLKDLYSHDSLAIYTLLDQSQRAERLQLIEEAFKQIQDRVRPQAGNNPALAAESAQSGSVPDPEASTGAYLGWAREQAGMSIRQLADRTKISSAMLEDIEAERVAHLPSTVYLRGFVREFSRSLGLSNATEIAEFYVKRISPEPVE